MMIETTSAPTLHSPVCLHLVLTNHNAEPLPAYKYIVEMNVTDSGGNVVYHGNWGATSLARWNMTTGNFWEIGAFWYPAQSSPPVLRTGTYRISAVLFMPGSSISVT